MNTTTLNSSKDSTSPNVAPRILRTQTGYAIENLHATNLPARQSQILLLIAKGRTEPEIANELNCSKNTIRGQKKTLFYKFRADSSTELVTNAFAKKNLTFNSIDKKAA